MLLHVLQHFLILHFLAWQLLVFWVDFGVKLKIWCKWVLLSGSWPNFLACFPPSSFLDSQCLCHQSWFGWNKNDEKILRWFFILGKPVWKMLADIFFLHGEEDLQPCNFSFNIIWKQGIFLYSLNVSWVLDQTSKVDDERIGNNGDYKSGSKLSGSPSRNSKFGWQTFP